MSVTLSVTRRVPVTPEQITVAGLPKNSQYIVVEVMATNDPGLIELIQDYATYGNEQSGWIQGEELEGLADAVTHKVYYDEEIERTEVTEIAVHPDLMDLHIALEDNPDDCFYYEIG
jgi:hypothetical protein